jgi:hypothetical protein
LDNTIPWYIILVRHGPRHPKQKETVSQDQNQKFPLAISLSGAQRLLPMIAAEGS